MNSTHRNYWMCSSCGEKFRNIKNLQQEIVSVQKKLKSFMVLGALILFIFVASLILESASAFLPLVLILAVADGANIFINRKRIVDMTNELHYLKKNCFD